MAARRTTKAVAEATGAGAATKAAPAKRGRKAANGTAAAKAAPKGQAPRKPASNGTKPVGRAPKGYAAQKRAEAEAAVAATPEAPESPAPASDEDARRARVEELSAQINALLGATGTGDAETSDRASRRADREAARAEREAAKEARIAARVARRNSPDRLAQAAWRGFFQMAKQYRTVTSDEELRKLLVIRVRTAFEEWLAAEDAVVEALEASADEEELAA